MLLGKKLDEDAILQRLSDGELFQVLGGAGSTYNNTEKCTEVLPGNDGCPNGYCGCVVYISDSCRAHL